MIRLRPGADSIAVAHKVLANEDFDQTALILWHLLHKAEKEFPGLQRHLYLEIEGHRLPYGGFDSDMFELQSEFLMDCLMHFLSSATTPLVSLNNPKPQCNEIPDELTLIKKDPHRNR